MEHDHDKGLLYDLRFDAVGERREDFVLNRAQYSDCRILIGGENFGCGSSREHAVWGLLQFGIKAIIAPGFGEIFYSNAMNNLLLLAPMPQDLKTPWMPFSRTFQTHGPTGSRSKFGIAS